jgi:hypothetical protein
MGRRKTVTKITDVRVVTTFDVLIGERSNAKRYEVQRSSLSSRPGEEQWTVFGGGWNNRRICDNDGATYKRVVKATKEAIAADAVAQ